jgi:uncharacterized membrane protein
MVERFYNSYHKYMAKKLAIVFGIVFVLVGLLGLLVPSNPIVGHGANSYFLTDALHDSVHLLVGIILIVVAMMSSSRASSMALIVFGVVYLILFLVGILSDGKLLGFVTANDHDDWLHLLLGIVLLIAGFTARGGSGNAMMMDKTTM